MHQLAFLMLAPAVVAAPMAAPVLTFAEPHFAFGRIVPNAKAIHRSRITNTGTAQLHITGLQPSCGCTSTVLDRWILAPGESTDIEIGFDPAGYSGPVRKSLKVLSDDPVHPSMTLTFEAEVGLDIAPSAEAIFFYDVDRTAPRRQSVQLVNRTPEAVRVLEASAPGAPYLQVGWRPEGQGAWIDVTLNGANVPHDRRTGTDTVVIRTDRKGTPAINLKVQWELRSTVVATPFRVSILEAAGAEHRQRVTLKQVDGRPFRVLSAECSNPALSIVGFGQQAASSVDLEVVVAPSLRAGFHRERIKFLLDDPSQPELELMVSVLLH